MSVKDIRQDGNRIAERLGENEKVPRYQIALIIELCGLEFTEMMMENALLIEEHGGMMTASGERRRSVGGIFFHFVRYSLPYDLRRDIFPPHGQKMRRLGASKYEYPPFKWEKRAKYLKKAFKKKGKVQEVHIKIEGRPANIEHREDIYIVTMRQGIADLRTFPRGVPEPPNEETKFVAYIGSQQWKKAVKDKLKKDKKATLILKGACFFDEEVGALSILVESVSTGKLKKPKKPAKPPELAEKPDDTPKKEDQVKAPPTPEEEDEIKLEDFPDDIAKKLRPLYGARRLFQKRLADIESLPEEKQKGLKAAQMMLERTEQQIETLEQSAADDEDTDE